MVSRVRSHGVMQRGRKADRLSIDPSGTVSTEKMRIIAVIFMFCAAGYVSAHELVRIDCENTCNAPLKCAAR